MSFIPRDLNKTKLPTEYDVIKFLLFLRQNSDKSRKLDVFKQEAVTNVIVLWQRADIPIITLAAVRKRVDVLVKTYYKISKNRLRYNVNAWNKLFKISRCKCGIESNNPCSCNTSNKIPDAAKIFFIDQCGPRSMTLDDVYETEPMRTATVEVRSVAATSNVAASVGYEPDSEDEEEFEQNLSESQTKQTNFAVADISLRNYCSALDRSDTSVRFGALLATMLIKDLRLSIAAKAEEEVSSETAKKITQFLDGLIITKNKVFRERVKFRNEALAAAKCDDLLTCISFDGKKEPTLKRVTEANVTRNVVVNEEHITIVKEPNSKFIGYATPADSTAVGVQRSIMEYLNKENYSMDHLIAMSCDGTPTNTGYKGGVIARMERHLQRPLQWLVCLFHFNELPFNALLRSLLGKQKGPGIWPGIWPNIGAGIQNCMQYTVNQNFERIPMGEMPENIEGWNIRGDQLYLFRMVHAVHTGMCDKKLASEKPGVVSTARWLTTASRILRFYITCTQPSITLKKIAEFIVKVYAPFWFLVKNQPLAIHGSRNVFKYISWIRQLPEDIQLVVRPLIKNNAYFLHPENILLTMITDPDPQLRSDGYEKILAARKDATGCIRQMYSPQEDNFINFEGDSYINVINWTKFELTEPPCLQFFTQDQLEALQYSNEIIKLPAYPCHSQNTERFVHVVHESALAVTDEQRMGHILSKLESRQKYSQLESRQNLMD